MKRRTLVKIGGSLLHWSEFPRQIEQLLATLEAPILLMGGGQAADVIREWDQIFQLGEVTAHHLALRSLSLSAHLLQQLLPQSLLVASLKELKTVEASAAWPILHVRPIVEELELISSVPLDRNWQTTSDSIALWIAAAVGYEKLLLVKSVDYPVEISLQEASQQGLIDLQFPRLLDQLRPASNLQIQWCDLRSSREIIEIA